MDEQNQPDYNDQTPKLGAGAPQSSLGSSFGSPMVPLGSVSRPSRPMRANTGTMSRSTSRTRPPAAPSGEDDEVEDRGQALIRQRQKERKQLRKAKERERRGRNDDTSGPPTGGDESFSAQQPRMGPSRSASQIRLPSSSRIDRRQAGDGYFSLSGSETPGASSPRDERRAASVLSTDTEDEGTAQDRASVIEDLVQSVIEDVTSEDEDEEKDDEGVTLKDRQDVSNRHCRADK